MGFLKLGYDVTVPANSTRYFEDKNSAICQPAAKIDLTINQKNPYIFNKLFSNNLISFDSAYCTTISNLNSSQVIPTLDYFWAKIIPHLKSESSIIDIGCGQGEFVRELRKKGLNAFGFDPVLRENAEYLYPYYWSKTEFAADLYVMRCVLPHIVNPWDFLEEIKYSSPKCLILIEFQNIDYIVKNKIWYGITHDHVNLFSLQDFETRFNIIAKGNFQNKEWSWVLLDPHSPPPSKKSSQSNLSQPVYHFEKLCLKFQELAAYRSNNIDILLNLKSGLAIWGAAGKGTVLASALKNRPDIIGIDADKFRQNKYLESSGVKVYSPNDAVRFFKKGFTILVSNPNHNIAIKKFVGERAIVATPSEFI